MTILRGDILLGGLWIWNQFMDEFMYMYAFENVWLIVQSLIKCFQMWFIFFYDFLAVNFTKNFQIKKKLEKDNWKEFLFRLVRTCDDKSLIDDGIGSILLATMSQSLIKWATADFPSFTA